MSANVPEIAESRLSRSRRAQWITLNGVLRRLRFSKASARLMVAELRKGLRVRFATEAFLDVIINEAEARQLLRGEPIRKLEILQEAARSSTEWVDVADLPAVLITRTVRSKTLLGWPMESTIKYEDTPEGLVEWGFVVPPWL